MKLNRIMVAAPGSGSGKTTITCSLLMVLKNRGEQVVSYKCGPDYIDPMFHKQVIGIPSKNLDTFFTDEDATKELFLKNRTEKDFVVMEGVILNKMSKYYYEIIKPLIEEELRIRVLGYFPDEKDINLESRHLGLVMPNESEDIQKRLQVMSERFEKTVDVEEIEHIAEQAKELLLAQKPLNINGCSDKECSRPVIAVAKDEAFCFYYEDNLLMLQENGAKITYFSPLHDTKLPDCCDALLIGGGYPELYAGELSRNVNMRNAIKQAIDTGMPIVAECGGFMYLHESITDKDGISHPMVGVIPATCSYKGKLVRFGYVEIQENKSCFLPEGQLIKGHEFHYFDSTDNGDCCTAQKPTTGREYSCVMEGDNYWMGFPHLYYPSNPFFAESFVKKAEKYKKMKEYT